MRSARSPYRARTSTLGAGKYDAEDDVGLSVYSPDAADSEPDFVEFTG